MPRYTISAGSKLVVQARSALHDTSTTWNAVTGNVVADATTLATTGATATFEIDMTKFDAGDWLRNRKLRKDFDLDEHARATFQLTRVRDVVEAGNGKFTANADGILRWRGRELELTVAGSGALEPTRLTATGRFSLDIRKLGLAAPKMLMFKMDDEVTVEVTLLGAVP